MKDRLEPQKRGPPKKTLMQFRHYLRLRDRDDCKAFVRLIASEHPFALEKFRQSRTRNHKKYSKVDRDKRVCRFCADAIESPEHALLLCEAHPDLVARRRAFYEKLEDLLPTFLTRPSPQKRSPH